MLDVSDFVLPVARVAVELRLTDGSRREVQVFVAAGDDISALLESPQPFLPVQDGGKVRLYARAVMMCVSVPRVPTLVPDGPPPHEREATVHLAGGEQLRGILRYVAPRERRRPADYLNEESRSFALHADHCVHYIAKAHVTCVDEEGRC